MKRRESPDADDDFAEGDAFTAFEEMGSMLAAIQAPIIMMSQNRQDAKDRVRSELDYEVNRRAAADIQGLARKLNLLGEQISDLEDLVRDKPIER
jgi:uncharacterized membrane protein